MKRTPAFLVLAGAALAMAVATGVPGFAWAVKTLGNGNTDARAFVGEIPLAISAAAFGAFQTRALASGSERWLGALLLCVNAAVVVITGSLLVIPEMFHTTLGGEIAIVGFIATAGVVILQTVLGALVWWGLAMLVRRTLTDLAAANTQGEARARVRAASWVLGVAAVHLVLKIASSGSVAFAVIAASVAGVIALGARRVDKFSGVAPMTCAAFIIALGFAFQVRACVGFAGAHAAEKLPLCTSSGGGGESTRDYDVLVKLARSVSNVADASSLVEFDRITLYVLPVGGGALDPATKTAVEKLVQSTPCAIHFGDTQKRPSSITVQQPTYITVDVLAETTLTTATDRAAYEHQVESELRAHFEPRAAAVHLIHMDDDPAPGYLQSPVGGEVMYSVGGVRLAERVQQMKPGTVAVIGRVDFVARAN